jgi:uncharacterized LabA/DUF88 family protein
MSPFYSASAPTATHRAVMIFIDGGYLRKIMTDEVSSDSIDFDKLRELLIRYTGPGNMHVSYGTIAGELIRIFYYDAIVEHREDAVRNEEQQKYFDLIKTSRFYEVRLGRLIKTGNEYKQKGVDVLLASDMITKAYQNQYDICILLAGDDDLVDVVQAVKNAGKRVFGVYKKGNTSKRLIESFDSRYELNHDLINSLILKQP